MTWWGSWVVRGLSPRGRGKHNDAIGLAEIGRSIPAWAGETATIFARVRVREVYPRVGGGNARC